MMGCKVGIFRFSKGVKHYFPILKKKKRIIDRKHFRLLVIFTITQILEAVFLSQLYTKTHFGRYTIKVTIQVPIQGYILAEK